MYDIVDLSKSSQCPSTEALIDIEVGFRSEFLDNLTSASSAPTAGRRGGYARGASNSTRSSPISSQSQASFPHKVWRPNWTEAKMLVLIDQKHIE